MDRLESLTNSLSQITMYDIKSMYNQAKNVVLNVSEMEGKVREATNDEAWGASSTLMQEIAQGTFNFQNFNEIMPCIYARFMEKEAKQWRQIYKALQLLEYLVKNGSERVVDDARSHIATIKMLRNFYYIDEKGKDQGLNVRNRSRELVELLGDVEKIRTERRKAKANKSKYIGTGNDGMSFSSGGSRYGGFGSESAGYGGSSSGYGGGSGGFSSGSGNYGGDYSSRDYGGDYSGGGSGGFRDSSSRKGYDEYDAGDDDDVAARRSNSISASRSTSSPAPRRSATTPVTPTAPVLPKAKAKAPEPVQDLLGLDDDFGAPVAAPPPQAAPQAAASLDDDFDDFQSAPVTAPAPAAPLAPPLAPPSQQSFSQPFMQPQPRQTPLAPQAQAGANLFSMLGATTTSPPPMGVPTQIQPAQASKPNYIQPTALFASQPALAPTVTRTGSAPAATPVGGANAAAKPAAKSSGNFDDLWSMSLGGSASASKPQAAAPAKSIRDLEKEKAQAGIWGASQQRPPMGQGFGNFGGAPANNAAPPSSSGNGLDDLLF